MTPIRAGELRPGDTFLAYRDHPEWKSHVGAILPPRAPGQINIFDDYDNVLSTEQYGLDETVWLLERSP